MRMIIPLNRGIRLLTLAFAARTRQTSIRDNDIGDRYGRDCGHSRWNLREVDAAAEQSVRTAQQRGRQYVSESQPVCFR